MATNSQQSDQLKEALGRDIAILLHDFVQSDSMKCDLSYGKFKELWLSHGIPYLLQSLFGCTKNRLSVVKLVDVKFSLLVEVCMQLLNVPLATIVLDSNINDSICLAFSQALWNIGVIYSLYSFFMSQPSIFSKTQSEPQQPLYPIQLSIPQMLELQFAIDRIKRFGYPLCRDVEAIFKALSDPNATGCPIQVSLFGKDQSRLHIRNNLETGLYDELINCFITDNVHGELVKVGSFTSFLSILEFPLFESNFSILRRLQVCHPLHDLKSNFQLTLELNFNASESINRYLIELNKHFSLSSRDISHAKSPMFELNFEQFRYLLPTIESLEDRRKVNTLNHQNFIKKTKEIQSISSRKIDSTNMKIYGNIGVLSNSDLVSKPLVDDDYTESDEFGASLLQELELQLQELDSLFPQTNNKTNNKTSYSSAPSKSLKKASQGVKSKRSKKNNDTHREMDILEELERQLSQLSEFQ